jgi:tetraacyldisaccharide 4'-kinase
MRTSVTGGLEAAILQPFFSAYALVSHKLVRVGMAEAVSLPVPVCSVGGISFGGTAKTPTVQYLGRRMSRWGRRPGVALRGWKGRLDRTGAPPALVSDGRRILLDWETAGDEARLHAERLLADRIPVAVGRDRVEACRLLIDQANVDILLLDDAFQFTRLGRNFDLALVDCIAPFGRPDGRPGPMREPVPALERADAIVLTHSEAVSDGRLDRIKTRLRELVRDLPPVFVSRTHVGQLRDNPSGEGRFPFILDGRRVVAFSGIGNPLSFQATLEGLGCDVAHLFAFPDHHPFKRSDLLRIDRRARHLGAETLITTSKDEVRLVGKYDAFSLPVQVVEIEVKIDNEKRFLEIVCDRMGLS